MSDLIGRVAPIFETRVRAEFAALTAIPPVELVPLVGMDRTRGLYGVEVTDSGAGLIRQRANYADGDNGGWVRNVWEATKRDQLPCQVGGIGIVHELGGPVVFAVSFDLPLSSLDFPRDRLVYEDQWPPRVALSF